MAFTSADLDTIDATIASGEKRVTFADGRTVEYQNVDQMIIARRTIASVVNATTNAAAGRPRKRFATYGGGF